MHADQAGVAHVEYLMLGMSNASRVFAQHGIFEMLQKYAFNFVQEHI